MILTSVLTGVAMGSAMSLYNMFKDKEINPNVKTKEEWEEFLAEIQIKNKAGNSLVFESKNSKDNFCLFYCPYGIDKNDIRAKEEYFKIFLGATRLEYEIKDKWLRMFFFKEELPKLIPYKDYVRKLEYNKDSLEIYIGKTHTGYAKIDLYQTPHILLAGATGSGKSCLTHIILNQLYNFHEVEMYLADLKKVELINYKKHKKTTKFVTTIEETSNLIDELLELSLQRYDLIAEKNTTDYKSYNELVKKEETLKPIVLVIEECIRLVSDKKLQKNLAELLFIARACGIYVILTIQRPTASCINPDIKSSLGNIIGLKTVNKINSQVICDSNKLKDLRGNGHGYLFNDFGETEFQAFYIPTNTISSYLL